MTFDLHLRGDKLRLAAALDHLDQHPGFERQDFTGAESGCAYVNNATGVYCYFHNHEHHADKVHLKSLGFSLNYNRPTFFALESMPLVVSLCQQFQLVIEDPQEEFVGPASLPDLINSWKTRNKGAVKALKAHGTPLNYMPERKANEWWGYVRVKEQLATELGDSVFVPELLILKRASVDPYRMFVCAEGIPQLLPAADVICIAGDDDEKRTIARGYVASERFLEVVAAYTTEYRFGNESFLLLEPKTHPEVIAKIRQLELMPFEDGSERVDPDSFHDVELD